MGLYTYRYTTHREHNVRITKGRRRRIRSERDATKKQKSHSSGKLSGYIFRRGQFIFPTPQQSLLSKQRGENNIMLIKLSLSLCPSSPVFLLFAPRYCVGASLVGVVLVMAAFAIRRCCLLCCVFSPLLCYNGGELRCM